MNTKNILIKELARSTKDFVQYMKEYAPYEAGSPFSEEEWDMMQVIEHVVLTDQNIMGLLSLTFRKRKNGHYSKYQMRDFMLNRRKKIKNPETITPKAIERKSIDIWLAEFEAQRKHLIEQVNNDQYNLESEGAFPHFQLGLLTKRDWLYLVCFHSDRHIAQVQEKFFCS